MYTFSHKEPPVMIENKCTESAKTAGTSAAAAKKSGKGAKSVKKAAKKSAKSKKPKASSTSKVSASKGKLTKRELESMVPDHKAFDLTLPQLRFVASYILHDGNVTKAARACHPEKTYSAAASFGARMMDRDNVVDAIDAYRSRWFDDLRRECRDRALKVLYARAFYDPAKVLGKDGNFILKPNPDFDQERFDANGEEWDNQKYIHCDMTDLPAELRHVVDGVERKSAGNNGVFTTVKLANKTESIRMLGEYMGLFDKGNHDAPDMTEETERQLKNVFREVE